MHVSPDWKYWETSNMGTKQLENDYLNIDNLLVRYDPLLKSIYKHFASYNNLFFSQDDYDDLQAQINLEFVRLCKEYNPTKGVDFPGYLKIHLQQRVYHYITKTQKTRQREKIVETKVYNGDEEESFNLYEIADLMSEYEFDKVLALQALDLSVFADKKHKFLVEAIIFEEKTLEEVAAEEDVSVREIQSRFNTACNILIRNYEEQQRRFMNKDLERPNSAFIPNIHRKAIHITRKPIILTH